MTTAARPNVSRSRSWSRRSTPTRRPAPPGVPGARVPGCGCPRARADGLRAGGPLLSRRAQRTGSGSAVRAWRPATCRARWRPPAGPSSWRRTGRVARLLLARAFGRLGVIRQAILHLEEALRLDPQWPTPLGDLGWAQLAMGDYGAAGEAFEASLRLDPDQPALWSAARQVPARAGAPGRTPSTCWRRPSSRGRPTASRGRGSAAPTSRPAATPRRPGPSPAASSTARTSRGPGTGPDGTRRRSATARPSTGRAAS